MNNAPAVRPVVDPIQHANNQDAALAYQALQNRVSRLETEIATLKSRISVLESK